MGNAREIYPPSPGLPHPGHFLILATSLHRFMFICVFSKAAKMDFLRYFQSVRIQSQNLGKDAHVSNGGK